MDNLDLFQGLKELKGHGCSKKMMLPNNTSLTDTNEYQDILDDLKSDDFGEKENAKTSATSAALNVPKKTNDAENSLNTSAELHVPRDTNVFQNTIPALQSKGPVSSRTRRSVTKKNISNSSIASLNTSQPEENITVVTNKRKTKQGKGSTENVVEKQQLQPKQPVGRKKPRKRKAKNATPANAVSSAVSLATVDLTNLPCSPIASISQNNLCIDGPRSYRQIIAEKAARCRNVDFIDLVSSPLVPVTGMVSLDSDEEEQDKLKPEESPLTSANRDNPEITVKIIWKGVIESFQMRKYQKFDVIFKELAERENADMNLVVFNIDSKFITMNDTPDSIDYKLYEFIEGRISVNKQLSNTSKAIKLRDSNAIAVKVQSSFLKRPINIELLKTEPFKILFIKCSEELNLPCDKLKMSFDGEVLEENATPHELDFEGGEIIDVVVKK